MKSLLAVLVLMLSSLVSAQSNAYAAGTFILSDGAVAEVDVFRYLNPNTKTFETQLFYNWCPQPSTNEGCRGGWGVIPNSAFQGTVFTNQTKPDTLRLSVDTNAVAGFSNYLCFNDEFSYCAIHSPTTGFVFSMTWTRTNVFALIDAYSEKQYTFGRLSSSSNYGSWQFTATPAGNALDSSVGSLISPTNVNIGTSNNSQTLKDKLAALRGRAR